MSQRKTRDSGRHSKAWKVWNENNPQNPILPDTGFVIHHEDENPWNNHISNLKKITDIEHKKHHTSNGKHPNQGKKFSKELRQKLSDAHKGKKLTEETKRKLSEKMKGNQYAKGSLGFRGSHTEETKRKISKANRGKSRPCSEETKRKISEAKRRRFEEKKKHEG